MDRHHRVSAGLKNGKIMWKKIRFSLWITKNQFTTYQLPEEKRKKNRVHDFVVLHPIFPHLAQWTTRGKNINAEIYFYSQAFFCLRHLLSIFFFVWV